MNADLVSRAIQLILAPVVLVSSAAIVLNGLLTHYGAVNDRLRSMNRERFDLVRTLATSADPLGEERLKEIDYQVPELLDRHRLIHHAVVAMYLAMLLFILSMFAIAVALVGNTLALALVVLALLLVGTAVLLAGILLTVREVGASRQAITFEVKRVMELRPPSAPRS